MTEEVDKGASLNFFGDHVFWDNNPHVSYGIFFVSVILTFVLIRHSEPAFPDLDIGRSSPISIVAQTDFVYYDVDKSKEDINKTVNCLDPVYKISDIDLVFEKASNNFLSKKFSSDDEEKILEISKIVFSNLSKIIFLSQKTFLLISSEGKDRIKDFVSLSSTVLHIGKAVIPECFWKNLRDSLNTSFDSHIIDEVLSFFSNIVWSIKKDPSSQKKLRDIITSQTPKKFVIVNSGSMILEKGETVTSNHFVMLKAMRKALLAKDNVLKGKNAVGILFLIISFMSVFKIFISSIPSIANSNRHILLMFCISYVYLILSVCIHKLFLDSLVGTFSLFVHAPLFSPVIGFLVCSIYPAYISSCISFFLTSVLVLFLPVNPIKFLSVNVIALVVVLANRKSIYKKKDLVFVVIQIWFVVGLSLGWMHYCSDGVSNYKFFAEQILFFLCFLSLLAISAVVVLPLIETIFNIVTDSTISEYIDPSHPLLKRLSIEAPGTYQHSLLVAHLAESAAAAIDARSSFCRAAALFHDVGKLSCPDHFIENQHGGINIHNFLEPNDSANIIISHVTIGVEIAKNYGIPKPFVDIIREHHGTSLVYYFYNKSCHKLGSENVDQELFRYKGPKPTSKESVIIMIADSLEAASRSLDEISYSSVSNLFENIVKNIIQDGQLSSSPISFKEINIIKNIMVSTLIASVHVRCKYPNR